jgi:hypothetical protein
MTKNELTFLCSRGAHSYSDLPRCQALATEEILQNRKVIFGSTARNAAMGSGDREGGGDEERRRQ